MRQSVDFHAAAGSLGTRSLALVNGPIPSHRGFNGKLRALTGDDALTFGAAHGL